VTAPAAGALDFPWPGVPEPGEAWQVAPGVLWARLPLPFRLDHVNVWLIDEDDGWTVIDTGCVTDASRLAWGRLLAGPMKGGRIRRVIATHGHVDHIGMSGALVQRFDAVFATTFAEWAWARFSHIHDVPEAAETLRAHLVRAGFDEAATGHLMVNRRGFVDLSSPVPGSLAEIRDRETLVMAGRPWEVAVTGGHAYQHCSFHDRASRVLIVGDQVLPRISPAITVYELVPDADPLADFLRSFARFADVADDALILPSHGRPFRGLHCRIAELETHHRQRLDATLVHLRETRTAAQLTRLLFPHVEGPEQTAFALGETLAHLNHLLHRGEAEAIAAPGAATRYRVPA
jgi:glyoxylase-like metal-dependent hydrolase (beta-lactamase superfamily II)